MSILEFLDARISEDEHLAVGAMSGGTNWGRRGKWSLEGVQYEVIGDEEAFCHPYNADHIARHDPVRVLAECGAKRKMLANIPKQSDIFNPIGGTSAYVLLCLAAVYADHPDYLEEWKL